MAVAFDAVSGVTECSVTSTTHAHTTSGSDRAILVGVNNDSSEATDTVTYAAVSLTEQAENIITSSTTQKISLWHLLGAATGANNVVASYSGTCNPSLGAISYTGVLGSIPDASNNDNQCQTCDSLSTAVTTVDDNCLVVLIARSDGAMSAGAGTTERTADATAFDFYEGDALVTPAGSDTLIVNKSSAGYHAHIAISLSPLAATSIKSINGLAIASIKSINGLAIASVKSWKGLA